MVIDLDLCISCNACTMACKAEHATQPGVFWSKVLEKESGRYPNVKRLFIPVLCNHCADAPCKDVCPSGATYTSEDGRVLIDYELCIGCRACVTSCPYDARHYIEEETFYYPNVRIPHHVESTKGLVGIVQKCNFCDHRLIRGEEPACVDVCPTSCRVFGDLNDEKDDVSILIREKNGFQLLKGKKTDPSVYYILKDAALKGA